MQQIDIAYIAGLFDGEASFHGRLANKYKTKTGGSVLIQVAVQACSLTMIEACKQFYDQLGIHYRIEFNRLFYNSTRPAHKIEVRRKADVMFLLKTLYPFLRVKKAEAEIIIDWLENWGHDMRGCNKKISILTPSKQERNSFLNNLKQLKKVA